MVTNVEACDGAVVQKGRGGDDVPEADPLLVLGAGDREVLEQARVAPACVLSWVSKGARSPVVHKALAAAGNLHTKEKN